MFFLGGAVYLSLRLKSLWSYFPLSARIFNVGAIGFVSLISFLAGRAAYVGYMGKNMKLAPDFVTPWAKTQLVLK